VAFKGEDGTGVGRLDVVELDRVVPGGGEIALVGRYTEAVYLGVGGRDCARADSGKSFPKSSRVSKWLLETST
jgi:hypothetical protein